MRAPRISREEFKKKMESGEAITILDVRAPASYEASKIKIEGAVRVPLEEVGLKAAELDPAKEIVAYCT